MATLNTIIVGILFFFLAKITIESSIDPRAKEVYRGPASIDQAYQDHLSKKNSK